MSAFICSLRRYTAAASTATFRFSSYRLLLGSCDPPPLPPRPHFSRCHHQITVGPLMMCPGNVFKDKVTGAETIYDHFYDPQTGIFKRKERRLQSVPNTVKICASSRGWLGLVDTTRDCSLYLANSLLFSGEDGDRVLSGEQSSVFKLPSIETLTCVSGITKGGHHNKDYVVTSKCGKGMMKQQEYSGEDLMCKFMKGIILSSDPYEEQCTAMLVFGETIAFCKPGIDDKWMEHHQYSGDDEPFNYSDWMWKPSHPVYLQSHKRFYNLFKEPSMEGKPPLQNPSSNGGFESWDVTRAQQERCDHEAKEPNSATPYVIRHQRHKCQLKLKYAGQYCAVVADEQSGDLLLAVEELWNLRIYRLQIDERRLMRATSTGDVAVFVGPYECFSLSVQDFPQLRRNSVYSIYGWRESSVIYNIQDNSVTPLECPWSNSYSFGKQVFWISPPRTNV